MPCPVLLWLAKGPDEQKIIMQSIEMKIMEPEAVQATPDVMQCWHSDSDVNEV